VEDAEHGNLPRRLRGGQSSDDSAARGCYGLVPMAQAPAPSARKLVGIASILLLIVVWAAFVASLAQVVGQWPVLVQAPFYL